MTRMSRTWMYYIYCRYLWVLLKTNVMFDSMIDRIDNCVVPSTESLLSIPVLVTWKSSQQYEQLGTRHSVLRKIKSFWHRQTCWIPSYTMLLREHTHNVIDMICVCVWLLYFLWILKFWKYSNNKQIVM